jgi:hypothetical protein
VKDITWHGRSYLDQPFDATSGGDVSGVEVTMTNAAPVLTGTIHDAQGTPASGAFAIIFPVDRALWTNNGMTPPRIRNVVTQKSGTYRLSLPAGEYFVIAVETPPPGWHEPEFMESAATTAARVNVGWGEAKSVDLTLPAVK